jgi:hypothetical protein
LLGRRGHRGGSLQQRSRLESFGDDLGESVGEHLPEMGRIKGLGQPAVETHFRRLGFIHFLERAGHEDETHFLEIRMLVDGAFDFERGFSRQGNIDQNSVRAKKRNLLDRIVSVGNGLNLVTFVRKREADDFLNGQTVVRYKKFFASHYV